MLTPIGAFSILAFASLLVMLSCNDDNDSDADYFSAANGETTYRREYYGRGPDDQRATYWFDTLIIRYLKDTAIQRINYKMLGWYGTNGEWNNIQLVRTTFTNYFERSVYFDPYFRKLNDHGFEYSFLNSRVPVGTVVGSDETANYVISEKGITMTVNNIQYERVIHVEQKLTCCNCGADRYYAPNVGLIFAKLQCGTSGTYVDAEWTLIGH